MPRRRVPEQQQSKAKHSIRLPRSARARIKALQLRGLELHLKHSHAASSRGKTLGGSSAQRPVTTCGAKRPPSTSACPNLSCAPTDGEQRLSKQELVRQQIAQETFPNEVEGLVPLPRAGALQARRAGQHRAVTGARGGEAGGTLAGSERRVWLQKGLCHPLTLHGHGFLAFAQEAAAPSARGRWGPGRGSTTLPVTAGQG